MKVRLFVFTTVMLVMGLTCVQAQAPIEVKELLPGEYVDVSANGDTWRFMCTAVEPTLVPPTETPLPTETPVLPTETSVPPTDTPIPPTDTPQPTATPDPVPPDDEYVALWVDVPPVIDGVLDEYGAAHAIRVEAGDSVLYYRLLWDAEALYVAAQVSDVMPHAGVIEEDGDLWNDDSLEMMFDTLHDGGGDLQADDYKFFINRLNTHLDSRGFDAGWDSGYTSVVVTDDAGYVIEARIPWANWTAPDAHQVWGLDVVLNDQTDTGIVYGAWANSTVNNPDGWGDVRFYSEDAPEPTSVPIPTEIAEPETPLPPTSTPQPTNTPTGDVRYVSPGDNLSAAVASMAPGETLILRDGVYNSAMSVGVSGVTIRAEHDGKAVVDGQMSRIPLRVSGSRVVIEGIRFQNSSGSTVIVNGSDVTLRRVSAYNARDGGNVHVWEIGYTHDVLIEDCIGSGTGRYIFLLYDSENITLRRVYSRWQRHTGMPAPKSPLAIYGTRNVTIENFIGLGAKPEPGNVEYTDYAGVYITWASYNRYQPENITFRGSAFYDNYHAGIGVYAGAGNTQISDSVIFDNLELPCQGGSWPCWGAGYGVDVRTSRPSVQNSTFVNNTRGVTGVSSPGVVNSLFVDNQTAMSGSPHAYCNFWNNNSNGVSLVGSDRQQDPRLDVDRYGHGAYFFVPVDSPLQGAGQAGADIGANVLYRYLDGTLTGEPLWPWPLEARICAEMAHLFGDGTNGISVTYDSHDASYDYDGDGQAETYHCTGGIWRTLEGVYD